jgi:hypothetical protein
MKAVLFGILCFTAVNCLPAFAVNEPQTLDPKLDQALISRLGLWSPGQPVPDNFNILVIGQDDSQAGNARNGRARLGSRSDIIMLLSLNRITRKINILSVYRDHPPTAGCEARIGTAPDGKINGVYSIRGRQGFVPCIEGMLEEMTGYLPRQVQADVLDRSGRIKVNALIEGTRSQTVSPLGRDIVGVVSNNKMAFLSTYGAGQTAAALGVLVGGAITGNSPAYLLGSNLSEEEARKMVDPKYLSIELKERKIYPAGGYQRAFNLATSLATILGWAGYGINQWKRQNYEFLGKFFGEAVNKNMGRSVDVVALEKEVLMKDGEHLFVGACYKNGSSPVRIVQWGESADTYSIFVNGKISHSGQVSLLRRLKYVDILPAPSNCD